MLKLKRNFVLVVTTWRRAVRWYSELSKRKPRVPTRRLRPRAGRAIYQANCSGCHAADLTGLNSASRIGRRTLHEQLGRPHP